MEAHRGRNFPLPCRPNRRQVFTHPRLAGGSLSRTAAWPDLMNRKGIGKSWSSVKRFHEQFRPANFPRERVRATGLQREREWYPPHLTAFLESSGKLLVA